MPPSAAPSGAVGAFLVDTGGRDTGGVAAAARALLGPTATVTDIADVRARIGSSLTAVDLTQLTRVELGFALALAVAAGVGCQNSGLGRRPAVIAARTCSRRVAAVAVLCLLTGARIGPTDGPH